MLASFDIVSFDFFAVLKISITLLRHQISVAPGLLYLLFSKGIIQVKSPLQALSFHITPLDLDKKIDL